jgi:hypothetical protein
MDDRLVRCRCAHRGPLTSTDTRQISGGCGGSLLVLAKAPLHLTDTDIRWLAVGPTFMLCLGGFFFSAVSARCSIARCHLHQLGDNGPSRADPLFWDVPKGDLQISG